MADQFSPNQVPTQTHAYWAAWRLVRLLLAAGWTLRACGDGTNLRRAGVSGVASPIVPGSGDDLWTSFPASGSGAWCCLQNPTLGVEVLLWRGTTSDANGKIIVGKQTAFSTAGFASATASDPGTIPSGVGYLRGSSGSFQTWFGGGSNAIARLHIGVRDIAGAEAGAFYLLGATPGAGSGLIAHQLRFSTVTPGAPGQGDDPEPYAFFAPESATTASWASFAIPYSVELLDDGTAGTDSCWWAFRADGAWSQFGGMVASHSGGYAHALAANDPYATPGTWWWLVRALLVKHETGHTERKGYVRSFRFCAASVSSCDVFGAFEWAKFGTGGLCVFWDGVTSTPLVA